MTQILNNNDGLYKIHFKTNLEYKSKPAVAKMLFTLIL